MFGEGVGRGRLLHRRAFAPFLPPILRDNPSKERLPEGGLERWRVERTLRQQQDLSGRVSRLAHWHPTLAQLWDLDAIRRESEAVLASPEPTLKAVVGTTQALATMEALSGWWQALDG